jgi:lysyl-tRNA synthetase class 2
MSQTTRNEAEVRTQKVEQLRSQGIEPYPSQSYQRTHTTAQVREYFAQPGKELENGQGDPEAMKIRLSGRITSFRSSGSICFIDLTDTTGKLQLKVEKNWLKANRV